MQWGESNKSLMKSKIALEFAELRRELEKITEAVTIRLDSFQTIIDSRINIESAKTNSKMELMLGESPKKAAEMDKEKQKKATEESLKGLMNEINKLNERIDQLEEINMEVQGNVLDKEIDKKAAANDLNK